MGSFVQLPPNDVVSAGPVKLTYYTVREVNAARDDLPPAQRPALSRTPVWTLDVGFAYRPDSGALVPVPAHSGNPSISANHTDLATVPPALWGILAPYGNQMRPAVMHDHLCDLAAAQSGTTAFEARRTADRLFRESLGVEGVDPVRRYVFWAGVAFGRALGYRPVSGGLLAALAFAGTAVLYRMVVLLFGTGYHWTWLPTAPVLVPLVVFAVLLGWLFFRGFSSQAGILAAGAAVGCLAASQATASWLGWWGTFRGLAAALGVVLVLVVLVGVRTNVGVGLIAVGMTPLVLPVLVLTTAVAVILYLLGLFFGPTAVPLPTLTWSISPPTGGDPAPP